MGRRRDENLLALLEQFALMHKNQELIGGLTSYPLQVKHVSWKGRIIAFPRNLFALHCLLPLAEKPDIPAQEILLNSISVAYGKR